MHEPKAQIEATYVSVDRYHHGVRYFSVCVDHFESSIVCFQVRMPSVSVQDFYERSRLHFIGDWKYTARDILSSICAEDDMPNDVGCATIACADAPPSANLERSCTQCYFVHIDMDCFFASIAMRERPELRSVPLAVCYEGKYAEISSCNYAARAKGIRSGMYIAKARELCPEMQIAPYNFEAYRSSMAAVYRIVLAALAAETRSAAELGGFTAIETSIEITAVDDLYIALRYTCAFDADKSSMIPAWREKVRSNVDGMVSSIRSRVFEATGCTASAGIAENCLLAKLLGEEAKPNGQKIFTGTTAERKDFMKSKEITDLPGIGPVIAQKILDKLNTTSCADVQLFDASFLQSLLGAGMGKKLHRSCRGLCDRSVVSTISESADAQKRSKVVACGINYGVRPSTLDDIIALIQKLCQSLAEKLVAAAGVTSRVHLTVKYRHPDAPVETYKKGAHGWCKEAVSSSPLEPPSSDQMALLEACKQSFTSMPIEICDVRGITARAKLEQVSSADQKEQSKQDATLTQIYKRKESEKVGNPKETEREGVKEEHPSSAEIIEFRASCRTSLEGFPKISSKVSEVAVLFKSLHKALLFRKYVSVQRVMQEIQKLAPAEEYASIRHAVQCWTTRKEGARLRL